jgi:hypothetical protein
MSGEHEPAERAAATQRTCGARMEAREQERDGPAGDGSVPNHPTADAPQNDAPLGGSPSGADSAGASLRKLSTLETDALALLGAMGC